MSYNTGSATSWSGLLSALTDTCTDAGWSWGSGSNTLSKGNCNVILTTQSETELRVIGTTGGDVTVAPSSAAYARMRSILSFAWPVTYHIHISDDDVIMVINYAVDRYQWLGFGIAKNYGLTGTGAWYGAFCGNYTSGTITISATNGGEGNYANAAAPFWNYSKFDWGRYRTAYLHGQLDGYEWLGDNASSAPTIPYSTHPLLGRMPSKWNSEAILLPAQILHARASRKWSMVAEIQSFRLTRIDYYEPGQIITLGSDKWKIYPFHQKNSSVPAGGNAITHTGTLGWAIKYDGD